ncbi:hypothetical protein HaLaN_24859 [Haematococcus lacustris]|uniref:Uncharacterized protein n=1 Tax=Haematococcus lacustris TaxID=44745 RepID=A0A699ZVH9_HAELA|nr:hypothetical protein HaLaN_24859 [Haematococcus lacustris]
MKAPSNRASSTPKPLLPNLNLVKLVRTSVESCSLGSPSNPTQRLMDGERVIEASYSTLILSHRVMNAKKMYR